MYPQCQQKQQLTLLAKLNFLISQWLETGKYWNDGLPISVYGIIFRDVWKKYPDPVLSYDCLRPHHWKLLTNVLWAKNRTPVCNVPQFYLR